MSITNKEEIQDEIQFGDHVLLYFTTYTMDFIKVEKGKKYRNEFTKVNHDDLVGQKFGKKFGDRSTGYFYPLKPTPELWTSNLSKRTQILYSADISVIISNLGLKPGSVVAESGTGSGSLTTSMARTVAPTGHIYTFEINEERVKAARKDFETNHISDIITVQYGDVCSTGFQNIPTLVDAVFLDLPTPWGALDAAEKILREGGLVCNFSPCIEQVSLVCSHLREKGFIDLVTIECLQRKYDTFMPYFPPFPMAYEDIEPQSGDEKSKGEVVKELKMRKVETQKPVKRKKAIKDNILKGDVPMAVPVSASRGHTGFLTFARLISKKN